MHLYINVCSLILTVPRALMNITTQTYTDITSSISIWRMRLRFIQIRTYRRKGQRERKRFGLREYMCMPTQTELCRKNDGMIMMYRICYVLLLLLFFFRSLKRHKNQRERSMRLCAAVAIVRNIVCLFLSSKSICYDKNVIRR